MAKTRWTADLGADVEATRWTIASARWTQEPRRPFDGRMNHGAPGMAAGAHDKHARPFGRHVPRQVLAEPWR